MSTETSLSCSGQHASAADRRPPLALIAGPTASGKSDLAVRLALAEQAAGGRAVVINADSAQVYADLAVLSARPSPEEMQSVPHHLFGAWDGAQACSAADWAQAAKAAIAAAHAQDALPILVGGTGLYIRTLIEGIAPIPPIDPATRAAVRALPVAEAHAALSREDPARAALLNPADTTRVARALEVVRSTGQPLAHWQGRREGGIAAAVDLRPLVLLPDRAWLYARCDLRFERMWQGGALEEVAALLARNLDPDLPVMRAIGVPEIAAFLRGEMTAESAIAAGQQATRRYAKRQFTWAKHQFPGEWPRGTHENFLDSHALASLFQNS
ncbi:MULTISPECIES: tRNA (adenosine(37)-N6)-dimethylallyltransferase MiaA [unclassified Novosphingobium]|uniref:tRNA (adenosine(37)-N6)-dimethylallyltransferase MiaA n=1 Tax=unclassified Novosphingobium TaxID=2644732 RepID=UPI00146B484C|nr:MULTISPECIES: tRNA (adenosine(37)-N6)-dimethylallyltransferase MiaA [unclassified Novosphingobium]NMN03736.1 tRNA dimethylallyltransferase [Novosphingobium sp. SG919]NMN86274.1 tRNA dimethylallyltransferase [Novosphingobium sp. SG916]